MRWSKVRAMVEERFAPGLRGRVTVHSTRYGGCSCGRGWIAVDGEELADLNTQLSWINFGSQEWPTDEYGYPVIHTGERTHGNFVEPGEFTRYDLHRACREYLRSSIASSLASTNSLVQSLAVLDARVGKRRLLLLGNQALHPLTRHLLEVRLSMQNSGTSTDARRTRSPGGGRDL